MYLPELILRISQSVESVNPDQVFTDFELELNDGVDRIDTSVLSLSCMDGDRDSLMLIQPFLVQFIHSARIS